MKFILDIAPLVAFFAGYKLGGLMTATVLLLIATFVSLSITYIKHRKIALSPLITGAVVAVFGGLTLIFNDETFIKIKPTLVNLLFAAILLAGEVFYRKGLLKYLFEAAFHLTDEGWRKLSLRWALFFMALAALNEYVWRHYPTEVWVDFKVFGLLGLTFLFTLCQLPLIGRYKIETEGKA